MRNIVVFVFLCVLFDSPIFAKSPLPSICPEIANRARWGARTPLEVDYAIIPVENVIIHHTVTPGCSTENECASLLRNMQNFHMETLEFHDIGYNFLVGGDGIVYEGAGWHKVGAHTRKYNTRSLGLAIIGNFTSDLPNKKQIQSAKDFIQCGVEMGELDINYKLFGARQVSSTASPGLKLYREIQNWPHFTGTPPN
uniref:Peptidoglycan-recognition protein n=1 Tax=Anatolica polita TaxID=442710 RepID=A0A0F6S9Z9_9CUCU|nr:PGRP-FD1 [Anatolica polita]